MSRMQAKKATGICGLRCLLLCLNIFRSIFEVVVTSVWNLESAVCFKGCSLLFCVCVTSLNTGLTITFAQVRIKMLIVQGVINRKDKHFLPSIDRVPVVSLCSSTSTS